MFRGNVCRFGGALYPVCVVHLFGDSGVPARLETVIDTGFSGLMTLPATTVEQMRLLKIGEARAFLADEIGREFDLYRVDVDWFGESRPIEVLCMGRFPLLGMAMMEGMELRVRVQDEGEITLIESV